MQELAERLGGELEGNGTAVVRVLASLADAEPGAVSFLANSKYAAAVATTRASAVIVDSKWDGQSACPLIRVANADAACVEAAALFAAPGPKPAPGVHPSAVLADDVKLGPDVCIGPHCVLEPGVRIGDATMVGAGSYVGYGTSIGCGCLLHPHVTVRERCVIGDRAIIHCGAVIGSDGFGYVKRPDGWQKIPQLGIVEIGDDVEIGANTTIDRARFGRTVIADGAKLDNLVQIAHNVHVGENTAIAALVGVSGSTEIGRDAQIGGQAGFAGHITVGDRSIVGAKAGVTKSVGDDEFVSGFPAAPHAKARRMHAATARLPQLREQVKKIDGRLRELERKLAEIGDADSRDGGTGAGEVDA